VSDELATAISDLEEAEALKLVQQQLDSGVDPMAILASCQEGMTLVGKRYETGEYFISDLMMAGEIFKTVTTPLGSRITAGGAGSRGKIVFGTVKGDIHNIGKDIVVSLLRAAGYEVLDLGVDVPPPKFVDAVKETGARMIGLSGLLTVAFDSMRDTIAALDEAGLRSRVRVMIGGGPMTAAVERYTGADAWSTNAQAAVSFANMWAEEISHE
jgi:methanogenic corrinoid protein MtbC1